MFRFCKLYKKIDFAAEDNGVCKSIVYGDLAFRRRIYGKMPQKFVTICYLVCLLLNMGRWHFCLNMHQKQCVCVIISKNQR
jgi:hypothetical protein